jgi:hypothetical protein
MSAIVSQTQSIEVPITIATSTTKSAAFQIGEFNKGSLQVPGTITGTAFTLEVSNDGTNFNALQVIGGDPVAAVPMTANEACPLPSEAFNYKYAKIVSGTAEEGNRTFKVFLKG